MWCSSGRTLCDSLSEGAALLCRGDGWVGKARLWSGKITRLLEPWVSLVSQALFIRPAPLQSLVLHWYCPVVSSLHGTEAESPAATDVMRWVADFICCCSADTPAPLKCCLVHLVLTVNKKIKPVSPQPDRNSGWTVSGRAFWALRTTHLAWGMSGRLEADQGVWVWKGGDCRGQPQQKSYCWFASRLIYLRDCLPCSFLKWWELIMQFCSAQPHEQWHSR